MDLTGDSSTGVLNTEDQQQQQFHQVEGLFIGDSSAGVASDMEILLEIETENRGVCTATKRKSLSRKERLIRRKRLALRNKMFSFEPVEHPTIFRRLIIDDDSDDSSVSESLADEAVSQKTAENDKEDHLCGKEIL